MSFGWNSQELEKIMVFNSPFCLHYCLHNFWSTLWIHDSEYKPLQYTTIHRWTQPFTKILGMSRTKTRFDEFTKWHFASRSQGAYELIEMVQYFRLAKYNTKKLTHIVSQPWTLQDNTSLDTFSSSETTSPQMHGSRTMCRFRTRRAQKSSLDSCSNGTLLPTAMDISAVGSVEDVFGVEGGVCWLASKRAAPASLSRDTLAKMVHKLGYHACRC
jgi:hypothetical protein